MQNHATVADILVALINQLPSIIAALAALVAAFLGYHNRQAMRVNSAKADTAVANTEAIAAQSEKIAAQTDGHITRLTEQITKLTAENASMQKTIGTLVNILTAQRVAQAGTEGKESITIPAVRTEDLAQAVDTVTKIQQEAAESKPEPELRKKKNKHD